MHLKEGVSAAAPAFCGCVIKRSPTQGQLLAVWRHSVSERDARTIVNAGIPVLVLHGRHDIVAAPRYGEALARRCAVEYSGVDWVLPLAALAMAKQHCGICG